MKDRILTILGATSPDQHLAQDLGLDSIDRVNAIIDVEEAFGIQITDDEAENCQTVADVIALVEARQ